MEKNDIKFQIRQLIKQAVQNVVLPVCYALNRFRKIDPELVVFADAHHDSRPAAMELLYRKLKKDGTWKITEHYLDYRAAGAARGAVHSIKFMQLYARAGYVIICDNFLPAASCQKRRGTKVIQLWHACGCYKKFGYDTEDDIPRNYHGANVYRNADLVTVSGEAAIKPFASAMRLPDSCIRATGVSRTDLYFRDSWKKACTERFYRKYPEAKGKKVVLWAPTFRGNAGLPEVISLNLAALQNDLGEEYYVLAALHPHMLKSTDDNEPHPVCDAERHAVGLPTEQLYPVTDVLIADYSSLIYEYLLFGKPLVLYVPDLPEYREARGFYMDISEIPGEIVKEEDRLADAVRSAVPSPGCEGFLRTYMGACDGHSTQRIAEWMAENR